MAKAAFQVGPLLFSIESICGKCFKSNFLGEDLDLGGGSARVRHSEPADQHVQQPRQVVQQEEGGLDLIS